MPRRLPTVALTVILIASAAHAAAPATPQWVADTVKPAVADKQGGATPPRMTLNGMLGRRVQANLKSLQGVDEQQLLAPFRTRPGATALAGEHAGKFLSAAALAYYSSGDAALREKIDRVAAELVKTQEPDGYLGTYANDKRFQALKDADRDVWNHRCVILGLLAHYQVTADKRSLDAARKAADLLCGTFGAQANQKSILAAAAAPGLSATAVLDAMARLHALTGDKRYLDFCTYIVQAYDQEKGPRLVAILTQSKQVNRIPAAKGHELLVNLVGLIEFHRLTGEAKLLTPVLNAWQDIVDKRLYVTGSLTHGEQFRADFDLPNTNPAGSVAETCATIAWVQLNHQLLRLTGDARYAQELERTCYNHLPAAQKPTGEQWCHFTPLEGNKLYAKPGDCCPSTGPTGMSTLPMFSTTTDAEGVVVNFFEPGGGEVTLADGRRVKIEQETPFPHGNEFKITLRPDKPGEFAVKLRIASWVPEVGRLEANTASADERATAKAGTYVTLKREWGDEGTALITFIIPIRSIPGERSNAGRIFVLYGPLVYAADEALSSPGMLRLQGRQARAAFTMAEFRRDRPPPRVVPVPDDKRAYDGQKMFELQTTAPGGKPATVGMLPFAEVGAGGSAYMVWLPIERDTRR